MFRLKCYLTNTKQVSLHWQIFITSNTMLPPRASQGSVHSFPLSIPPPTPPWLSRTVFGSNNTHSCIMPSHHRILLLNLMPLNPVWLCYKSSFSQTIKPWQIAPQTDAKHAVSSAQSREHSPLVANSPLTLLVPLASHITLLDSHLSMSDHTKLIHSPVLIIYIVKKLNSLEHLVRTTVAESHN